MTNGDSVTVTFDRKTAWLVRGALMAYRSSVEHVLADMQAYNSDARRDILDRLALAKLAVERAANSKETT